MTPPSRQRFEAGNHVEQLFAVTALAQTVECAAESHYDEFLFTACVLRR
ncbi:MAG: hypothetical protein AB9869_24875 [Verrucomicrobiia bacterium]